MLELCFSFWVNALIGAVDQAPFTYQVNFPVLKLIYKLFTFMGLNVSAEVYIVVMY